MATPLYLQSTTTQPGTGTNNTKANGSTSGWRVFDLAATRGSGVTPQALTTTAGPTSGQEIAQGGIPFEWVSPPLAAGVTVLGTVTFNIWASESANTENATLRVIVEKYDSTMTLGATVTDSTRTSATELTTTNAAVNWTATPTSTVFAKGDRIRVRVVVDDASGVNLGTGSVTVNFAGTTAAASGDSFVQFTEALTFASAPAGSILFLTSVDSGLTTAADLALEAWTSRGAGSSTRIVTSTAGWRTPIQFGNGVGAVTEWFTKPLQAFTLSGISRFSVFTGSTVNDGLRCEVALCDATGTLISVWGAANFAASGVLTASAAISPFDVSGADLSVSNGQRLRFRVYSDDTNATAAGTSTCQITFAGTSGGASGDTFVTMTQTLAQYTTKAPPFQPRTIRNSLLRR